MAKTFFKLFLSLIFFSQILSLKIQLVDEDFVIVHIGQDNKKEYKLLVDPVGPFTYMFQKVSEVTPEENKNTYKFQYPFGKFEGVWKEDYFYLTEDKIMSIKMPFLQITKKETKLKGCDGVLGLGYSFKHEKGNIYETLGKMYNAFKSNKMMSYDKKKKIITIGEFPERSNYNPTVFKIYQNEKGENPEIYLKLNKIRFVKDVEQTKVFTDVDINDNAMLTLMPVVIAPKQRVTEMITNYKNFFDNHNQSTYLDKPQSEELNKGKDKFFTDFYMTNVSNEVDRVELVFDRMAYKFDAYEEKGKYIRPTIRFGNDKNYPFDYWFIGIDTIGIERLDFNFEENTVKLYSMQSYDITKSKPQLLRDVFVYMTIICIMLGFMFRVFCQKKKQDEIKPGEELIELN